MFKLYSAELAMHIDWGWQDFAPTGILNGMFIDIPFFPSSFPLHYKYFLRMSDLSVELFCQEK